MFILLIEITLLIVLVYLLFGFFFAIAFIIRGITITDEGAHGSTIGFRIIIIPGLVTLWPFMLKKWLHAAKKVNRII